MKQAELFDWFFDNHPDLAEKLNWSPTKVVHLKRALYGLKQAGRQRQKHFSGILVSIGMSAIECDKGSYYGQGVLVVTHVDDSVYVGKKVDLDIFEKELQSHLAVELQGHPEWLLGVEVGVMVGEGGLSVSKSAREHTLTTFSRR